MVENGSIIRLNNIFDPFTPVKLKHEESGTSYGLGEAGYDVRINQDIHFTGTSKNLVFVDGIAHLGHFVLASTMEHFTMPENFVAIVHDKSTWARQGLSVFNTVIEPGWKGYLTLELVYHGISDLVIPKGSGIAQVIFHNIREAASYGGKYQNQPNKPVEAITHG